LIIKKFSILKINHFLAVKIMVLEKSAAEKGDYKNVFNFIFNNY
tara:strand:- start:47 stop:178 length:132 start_codon:yes stop_codon:yes gene_type:complete